MRKLNVTREAARALVAAGTEPFETATYEEPESFEPWRPTLEVRLARLSSAWRLDDAGQWRATCAFVDDESGATFDVYASIYPATSEPVGTPGTTLFYAIWNTRWELLASGLESSSPPSPAAELITRTVATGLVASVSSDGWLTLSTTGTTIRYYGESN